MNISDSKQLNENVGDAGRSPPELRVRIRIWRIARIIFATTIVFCLVVFLFAVSIYFLVSGTSGKQSVIQSSLESTLQNAVGPEYKIVLETTDIQFELPGLLFVNSSDVKILRSDNQKLVAEIGSIRFGMKFWRTLFGDTGFDSVVINKAKLSIDEFVGGAGFGVPSHMKPALSAMGRKLNEFSQLTQKGVFKTLQITESSVMELSPEVTAAKSVFIKNLELQGDVSGSFKLNGILQSDKSKVTLNANYEVNEDQQAVFKLSGEGLNLGDWVPSPESEIGPFGSNATIGWKAEFSFNPDFSPLQPTIFLYANEHNLRVGKELTEVEKFEVNLRLIPEKNQIELDRSELLIGKLHGWFIGGLRPANIAEGYAGPVEYEVIAEKALVENLRKTEKAIPAAFSARGFWFPGESRLEVSQALMATNGGKIEGSGTFGFKKSSVSISADASTKGISAIAVKQFWPFFLGKRARAWAHKHLISGRIENARMVAAIPEGIVGNIDKGARLKPEHLQMVVEFKDGSFQPFGKLPPVFDAKGSIIVSGMKVEVELSDGKIRGGELGVATLASAKFSIADFADRPALADAEFTLDGKASVLASIAESEPLRVMTRLKSKAGDLSGMAHANIIAKFPLVAKVKESEVKWNALVDLKKVSLSRKLSGRKLSNVNVLIDANPEVAWVSGTALIDGVFAKLDIVEPLGKKSSYKKSRKFAATLDAKTRKKIGLNLSPVIVGPIVLRVEQVAGKAEKQYLDLTKAEINLPWVGWSKGAGIPAKASYTLKTKSRVNRFNNISISGEGFHAKGSLVFDKTGLRSANMKNVALNEGDDFDLVISRKKGVFDIDVKGRSYDARGLINKLIHEGDFESTQGSRSVKVTVQMDRLIGFNSRQIKDASTRYLASGGKIDHLSIAGLAASGKPFQVLATREDDQTDFEFVAEDAGHALAFVNIYSRMQGGVLNSMLKKQGNGPYIGDVNVKSFVLVDEPRLKKLVSARTPNSGLRNGEAVARSLKKVKIRRAKFSLAQARIEKGNGYLKAKDGLMRGTQIGFTFDGTIYDENDLTNIRGTFMPAYGISRVVSAIPIIGSIFSNGRDGALIGITYRLRGKMASPDLSLNPLSLATPGIFNKIFEFKK
ncbi:MAG: hypothetical protein COB78_02040 [Hyphomicrobiales bacterium]|nr:MAG: hypothetical protein COB78_02040 [Hyphomicrobiales bacterium]